MHGYHVDDDSRTRIFLSAGALATVFAWAVNWALQSLPFTVPFWIEIPSVFSLFGVFVWLIDRFVWKHRWVRKVGLISIPDLNGTWDVEIRSSHDSFASAFRASATIRQSAFNISVSLETDQSRSHSISAAILNTNRLSQSELIYYYLNEPKVATANTMSIHYGTTWLRISDDYMRLEGEYYSGRGRQNIGTISLLRQP